MSPSGLAPSAHYCGAQNQPRLRAAMMTHDAARHFAPSLLRTTSTGQYAKYGPLPAGVGAPSMAV